MGGIVKLASPVPCITTCDVMVGAELPLCTSTFTQTEDPGTSDKHVITEVHMADLDYLTEVRFKPESNHCSTSAKHNLSFIFQELIKVKMANEQLRELNKTR